MTAVDIVPTTPQALAALIWERHTPSLWSALVRQLGTQRAAEVWWQAADLLEGKNIPIPRDPTRDQTGALS